MHNARLLLVGGLALSSCLDPSGEEGSAVEKLAQLNREGGDAEIVTFADFSSKLTSNCSAAGTCHSTGGGTLPLLESESDLFVAVNADLDPDIYVGPASLGSMKGLEGSAAMPPSGIMEDSDPDFVAQFEAFIAANFDESGLPIEEDETTPTTDDEESAALR